jgi:NAD(P)-dependent dehydrogenase (short-subunit alcohol dehydrogenase family)
MAAHMLANGAKVAILGRNAEAGKRLVTDWNAKGYTALFEQTDVLQEAEVEASIDSIQKAWGPVTLLINAAGGNKPGATIQPDQNFSEMNQPDFEAVVGLNLSGTVIPSKVCLRTMATAGRGHIVNISSMAADRPLTRVVGYGAAKAAINHFTRWLAAECAQKYGEGVRVNAIAPGFFITEQNKALLLHPDGSPTERAKQILAHTPFRRFGRPEELLSTLDWLCNPASSFVTGVVVPVDGGFSAFSGV